MRLEKDIFNSEIFGFNMANIMLDDDICKREDVQKIIEDSKQSDYKHLSIKIDISEKEMLNSFLECGFYLVDTQIMYEIALHDDTREKNTGITRPYDISDKERILEIARSAYHIDRFHSDLQLPNDRCDLYYEKWAKNLCEGLADKVFVVDIEVK